MRSRFRAIAREKGFDRYMDEQEREKHLGNADDNQSRYALTCSQRLCVTEKVLTPGSVCCREGEGKLQYVDVAASMAESIEAMRVKVRLHRHTHHNTQTHDKAHTYTHI